MQIKNLQQVPLVDLAAQQLEIHDQVWPAIEQILKTGDFIGGEAVKSFETSYARFVGAKHCIGVANGTDAIELALRASGIGTGDEVIVPANTFIATAEAVLRAGATPVLADVDIHNLLLDPVSLSSRITSRTAAVIPVHLYGQMAPMELISPIAQAAGAIVIEDAAQAQGAHRFGRAAGSIGQLAATSFYPGKNLGAAGDAGAVTTSNDELARRVRMLGSHGSEQKYVHLENGFNSRLDTIQAAVLSSKLEQLDRWNGLRRDAATYYQIRLKDVPGIVVPYSAEGNEDVWHVFVLRLPHRDAMLEHLRSRGIGAAIHYPVPLHKTPAWTHSHLPDSENPVAESTARELLSIPIYPHISRDQQDYVVEALLDGLERL